VPAATRMLEQSIKRGTLGGIRRGKGSGGGGFGGGFTGMG
jgi:hypothetical protein